MHGAWGLGANSLPVPKSTLATLKEYTSLLLVSAGLLIAVFRIGFRRCLEKGYRRFFFHAVHLDIDQDWTAAASCGPLLDCEAY